MFLKALLLLLTLLVAQTHGAECLNDTLLYTEGDVACPPGWFRWIGNNHCYFIKLEQCQREMSNLQCSFNDTK